ncbi:condensation domain-containing protein, partial [Rheinheimera gaetbuli]
GSLAYKAPKGALTVELKQAIIDNKAGLLTYLQQQLRPQDTEVQNNPITRVSVLLNKLPLSYAQQRLWLLAQIDGGNSHYNIPMALELSGTLDVDVLHRVFATIIERHQSLRTRFLVDEKGQAYQDIQAASKFTVELHDLSGLAETLRQAEITRLVEQEATEVFDLSRDLMVRARLLKGEEKRNILLVTMHHIASDGWSEAILIKEFSTLYQAYMQGETNPLAELDIQYTDFSYWQRNWLQGEVLEKQLSYWQQQLAGLPVTHKLPLDKPRGPQQSFNGKAYFSYIGSEERDRLKQFCRAYGATLFMGLHAVFSTLLARYSNETDIVVGSPIANRERAEIAPLIGFFVNTLVLRNDLSAQPCFVDLLLQSKQMLLDAYAHQQVPFEQVVERLQPERSLSHSPLFQIAFTLQNNEENRLELPGLSLHVLEQAVSKAKYELMLNVVESEAGLSLLWEYNIDLFEESTIKGMAAHFSNLLNNMLAQPEENVFKVGMLSEEELNRQKWLKNDTQTDYPRNACIHTLFEAQVDATPDAVALVCGGDELTYAELNAKANQLAHFLLANDFIKHTDSEERPDSSEGLDVSGNILADKEALVGICLPRSLDMVVAILGILKAGGAYVPLDPDYPEARLAYMLEDAKLDIVLTCKDVLAALPLFGKTALCLDDTTLQQGLVSYPMNNL